MRNIPTYMTQWIDGLIHGDYVIKEYGAGAKIYNNAVLVADFQNHLQAEAFIELMNILKLAENSLFCNSCRDSLDNKDWQMCANCDRYYCMECIDGEQIEMVFGTCSECEE